MPTLSNVNIQITASDQTGSGVNSALSNVSRLGGGLSSVGTIASGVFGGILGAATFRTITSGIGRVVSSAFSLNSRMDESRRMSESMVNAIARSEPVGTSAFGGLSAAARQYEKTMREIRDREQDGLEDYALKIDSIKSKILDSEREIAQKKEERLRREKEQLEDLADSYADAYERLTDRIEDEMMNFEERMYDLENQKADKIERLNEERASKEEDLLSDIADANEDLLAATTAAEEDAANDKIALLQSELAEFLAKNDAEIAKVEERMNHEIDFAQKKHDIKIQRLQEELKKEEEEYAKRRKRVEEDADRDVAAAEAAGNKKVANLQQQLAKEKREHERFLRDLEQSYMDAQAKMSLGSGGGGGGAKRTIDWQFDSADAFRDMDGGQITDFLDEVEEKYVQIGIKSPFNIADIQQFGRSVIQFTGGSADNMEALVEMSQALAAKNPFQGMQGATLAMVELLGSGTTTSLTRRFDIPKDALAGIENAKDATERVELLQQALERQGISYELVEARAAALAGAQDNVMETFQVLAAAVVKPIYTELTGALVGVNKFLGEHYDEIKAVSEIIGGFLGEGALMFLDFFKNLGTELFNFVGEEGGGGKIVDWFTRIWNSIMTMVTPALEFLKSIWRTVQRAIEEVVIPGMQRIFEKIAVFYEEIAPEVKKTLDFLKAWWEENQESIMAAVKVAWAVIEFVISTAIDVLKAVIKIGLAVIRGDWGAAWEGMKGLFKDVFNNIKTFAENVWDGIGNIFRNGINGVIDKVNGFIRNMNDKLGKASVEIGGVSIGGWQIPEIPKLADGGIVNGPTLAMIGEAGSEAVIPLSKGRQNGIGLGGGVSVYVSGNYILDERSAEDLADVVGRSISDKLALQGNYN